MRSSKRLLTRLYLHQEVPALLPVAAGHTCLDSCTLHTHILAQASSIQVAQQHLQLLCITAHSLQATACRVSIFSGCRLRTVTLIACSDNEESAC